MVTISSFYLLQRLRNKGFSENWQFSEVFPKSALGFRMHFLVWVLGLNGLVIQMLWYLATQPRSLSNCNRPCLTCVTRPLFCCCKWMKQVPKRRNMHILLNLEQDFPLNWHLPSVSLPRPLAFTLSSICSPS